MGHGVEDMGLGKWGIWDGAHGMGAGGCGGWEMEDMGWRTRGTWEMERGMGATGWRHEMGNMGDMREWDEGHGVCGMEDMKWGTWRENLKDVGWGTRKTWGT